MFNYIILADVADASDGYDKIDVSETAILGGRVTLTITLKTTCSVAYNWRYTFQNAPQMFHADNATIIEKVNYTEIVNTTYRYTLTLMNAKSDYKTNISFYCDSEVPVDTVTLDLKGKQKHHNVYMCITHIHLLKGICPIF